MADYGAQDPPAHIDENDFDGIPIVDTSDPDEDYERDELPKTKELLERFTTTKIPVIPTPRFDPVYAPTPIPVKRTTCCELLITVIVVELVLAAAPLLAGVYGGDGYTDNAVTFWNSPIRSLNARLIFTVVVMMVSMVNAALFITGHSDSTSATWIKFYCLAIVIMMAVMLRAGESRIEVVGMACLLAATVFSVPTYTDSLNNIVIPAACYLAVAAYAFAVKASDMYAAWDYPEYESGVFLDITVVLFCMCVPLTALCLTAVVHATDFYMSPRRTYYLALELTLVSCMCVMSFIPNKN